MKRIFFLLLAIAIGYYLYVRDQRPSPQRPFGKYNLDQLATEPLPKQVFAEGVRFYADGLCKDKKFLAIIKSNHEACLAHVNSQHAACLSTVTEKMPELLSSKNAVAQYSEQYVGCVTPK